MDYKIVQLQDLPSVPSVLEGSSGVGQAEGRLPGPAEPEPGLRSSHWLCIPRAQAPSLPLHKLTQLE